MLFNGTMTHALPLDVYEASLQSGAIRADAAQQPVVTALHALAHALASRQRKLFTFLRRKPKTNGLYLYGSVGRGKTMLMDMFFNSVEGCPKRRAHFHAFMADIHARLHVLRQKEPEKGDQHLQKVAAAIAKEAQLLCFDEFQVHNIADAMILGRLFQFLFQQGVVVVATSNAAPDELYKDGLQRALFLPFIALIRERMEVIALAEGRDYRQERLKGLPVYLVPHDNHAYAALNKIFMRLTDDANAQARALEINGRILPVPKAAKGVAWFTFDELCRQPLAASDYLALLDYFHTLLLENVPDFSDERRDEVLRFIHLVDVMYEAGAKLVVSAAAPAELLLPASSSLWAQYARTASRLAEMQSLAYLQKPHAQVKA